MKLLQNLMMAFSVAGAVSMAQVGYAADRFPKGFVVGKPHKVVTAAVCGEYWRGKIAPHKETLEKNKDSFLRESSANPALKLTPEFVELAFSSFKLAVEVANMLPMLPPERGQEVDVERNVMINVAQDWYTRLLFKQMTKAQKDEARILKRRLESLSQ